MKNNWITKKLDEVATVTMGQSPSSSSYNTNGEGVPFLQGMPPVVDSMGAAVPKQWTTEPTRVVEAGTALMTVRAPVGELFSTNNSVCLGRGLAGIKANSDISQTYLNYYLQFSKKQFYTLSQGSTFTAINSSDLKGIQVNLPSFEQQEYVGKVLNVIDQNISRTDHIIQKTEVLEKGMIQKLLTKGIGHKKYKKTKLGEIPDEWKIVELQSICDVRDGTHDSPKYVQEGYPLITSKNLTDSGIDFSIVNYISESDFNQVNKRSKVDVGDILFGMIGTIGKPVIVDTGEEFAIKNVALIKFSNTKSILNKFLLNYLKSNFVTKQFAQFLDGSSQKFIALGTIRKLDIICPKIDEQLEISNILESIETKLKSYIREKRELTQLKDGLMQDIFSQKVLVN